MTVLDIVQRMPWILRGSNIEVGAIASTNRLRTSPTGDEHVNAMFDGMWFIDGTNGPIASQAGDNTVRGIITRIMYLNGNSVPGGLLTDTELNDHTSRDDGIRLIEYMPIGGLIFAMSEDGLVTPITDANSGVGSAGKTYADFVYTAPSGAYNPGDSENLIGRPSGILQINSDTVNTTGTNLPIELLGVLGAPGNPAYSATAGSQRVFICKIQSSQADEDQ